MPKQKITKTELIERSIEVFRTRGYYRTNMSDLAENAGLTKGAFYHHFKSKEEVMIEALNFTTNIYREQIFSVAYEEDIPDEQKLKTMVERYYMVFGQKKGGCFYANTVLETTEVEETFKQVLKTFFEEWQAAITTIFLKKYSEEEAKDKSTELIADMEGSIILMQLYDKPEYLQKAVKRSLALY